MALIQHQVEVLVVGQRFSPRLVNVGAGSLIRHDYNVDLVKVGPNMSFAATIIDLCVEFIFLEEFIDFLLPLICESIWANYKRRQVLASRLFVYRCLI